MNYERWRRLEYLYHMVLEREPDQRIAFIAEACGGDEDLRRDINLLLSHSNSTQDLVGRRVWQSVAGMIENRDDVTPGTRFGPYEIVGSLGEGGMGRVYRGLDTRLGRPVAIKISAEQFSARFEREARAIAALNHPQICTLYETNEAQVTLLGSLPSIGGHVVGTPAYMSPEQARGEDVDQRTDIWAFGCLLFELLSAKRAFPGEFAGGVIVGTGASQPDWEILPAAGASRSPGRFASPQRTRNWTPSCRSAGGGTCQGHRSPRFEACQHQDHAGRQGQGVGLWSGESHRA